MKIIEICFPFCILPNEHSRFSEICFKIMNLLVLEFMISKY